MSDDVRVRIDEAAAEEILRAFAQSLGDVTASAVESARAMAPKRTGRYANSIGWAAYQGNNLIGGDPGKGPVHFENEPAVAVLYTRSPLGHVFELGSAVRTTKKSGANRGLVTARPHMAPAFLSACGRAAETISAGMRARLKL